MSLDDLPVDSTLARGVVAGALALLLLVLVLVLLRSRRRRRHRVAPASTRPVARLGSPSATPVPTAAPMAAAPAAPAPIAAEPVASVPVAEPVATEPVAEPVATEPVATEPVATEPVAWDPVASEPAAVEPTTDAAEALPEEPAAPTPSSLELRAPEVVASEFAVPDAAQAELAETDPPEQQLPASDETDPEAPSTLNDVPTTLASDDPKDPMNSDLSHLEMPAPARAHTGYAELSRRYAAEGRTREAALAQWAADLHVAGPLLDHSAPLLPSAQTMIEVESLREAVTAARSVALQMVPDADHVQALFSSVQHLPEEHPDETHQERPARHQSGVTVLLSDAADRMSNAGHLAASDPATARNQAREADLASFEALLLESALTHGDLDLVTVTLRRDLALAALGEADRTAPLGEESLAEAIHRTRTVLRGIVEPHELEALEVAFVPAAS